MIPVWEDCCTYMYIFTGDMYCKHYSVYIYVEAIAQAYMHMYHED